MKVINKCRNRSDRYQLLQVELNASATKVYDTVQHETHVRHNQASGRNNLIQGCIKVGLTKNEVLLYFIKNFLNLFFFGAST